MNFIYPTNFEDLFKALTITHKVGSVCETNHLLNKTSVEFKQINDLFPHPEEFHIFLRDFLSGVAYHEFGHSNECPIADESFSEIIQAVSTVLEQKKRIHPLILLNITNIFTDLIVNIIYGLKPENAYFRNALFLHQSSELILNQSDDTPFFYFVLLNEKSYQFHIPMRKLLEKLMTNLIFEDYSTKLKKLLQIFCPDDKILEKMWLGVSLSDDESWKVINHVSRQKEWGKMVYDFALEILDLFPPDLPSVRLPIPNSEFTEKFEKNVEYQRKIAELILDRKLKSKKDQPTTTGKRNNKSSKNKNAKKTPEMYVGENDIKQGLGSFNATFLLDALYRTRVKQLEISLPPETRSENLVLGWMNREIMTEKDNPMSFDPMMVYFLPGRDDVLLYKKTLPLTHEIHASIKEKGFPNLAIICDDSGSMGWEPWIGEGKYEAVIVMVYSLMQWLHDRDFAPVIDYNITCFSTTTRTSGWVDYFHLDEVLPILFEWQGGGTILDKDLFRKILEAPREKVIVLITDGDIYNAPEIATVIREHRNEIKFLLIQIGTGDRFAKQVQNMGFPVVELKDIKQMSKIVLDFVKRSYEQ